MVWLNVSHCSNSRLTMLPPGAGENEHPTSKLKSQPRTGRNPPGRELKGENCGFAGLVHAAVAEISAKVAEESQILSA